MIDHVLLIATTNAGKFREFSDLLSGLALQLRSLADLPSAAPAVVEDGDTYVANAAKKAVAIARWSGRPALADDSGLEVAAIGGAPGIRSARYAGESQDNQANIARLLEGLNGVPMEQRTARFRCALVAARPDGKSLIAEGTCDGLILETPRGSGGFGYDPLFLYPPLDQTFAELAADVKNRLSHRARACAALRPQLLDFLSMP